MTDAKIFNAVVGTAGHIDHGKSSLVRRLTGQDPDRLKEEKERGLTIDLGYAELDLGEGLCVGMIDVPGHEKFVRNMVAGATGMDYVMLVVAGDDGVMPQTREHLEIMSLLGVQQGLIALTKTDLVEPDFLDLVEDDLRDYLKGTFLEDAPLFRISSETGAGIDELKDHLREILPSIEKSAGGGVFRMPVQRAFSVKGFGTVVTGVPLSGAVSVGDTVEVLPRGGEVRVRGIQAYHVKTDRAQVGHRAALNLTDVDYKTIGRGYVVATPGFFETASLLELELEYSAANRRPLRNRTEVRFHTGTHDVLGRVSLLEAKALSPGERGLAQVELEEPVVIGPGDRFVVRCPSPSVTIGGGVVIGQSDRRLKRFRDRVTEGLRKKRESIEDPSLYLESLLADAGPQPQDCRHLAIRAKLAVDEARRLLLEMVEAKKAVSLERDKLFVHDTGVGRVGSLLVERLGELHAAFPLKMSHPLKDVVRDLRIPPALCKIALDRVRESGQVEISATGEIVLAGHEVALSREQIELAARVEVAFQEAGFATPTIEELQTELSVPNSTLTQIVELLVQQGVLVRLKGGMLFHQARIDEARSLLQETLVGGKELLATEFKDLVHSSRKYAIPLLEYFDELGLTVRQGNVRVLATAKTS